MLKKNYLKRVNNKKINAINNSSRLWIVGDWFQMDQVKTLKNPGVMIGNSDMINIV